MKPLFISHFWIVGSYFVSVITPVNHVILILKLAINHWNLGLRKCLIALLPLSGKKFQILRSWPMDYFASHRSVHFFGLFLVSGRVSAGWRGILYPAYPVLLQSPTTHIPCILQRFWQALSHARIYSSQKQTLFPKWHQKPTSPILRYSSVVNMEMCKIINFEIHRKLTKIAKTIVFSQWWSGEKGNLY